MSEGKIYVPSHNGEITEVSVEEILSQKDYVQEVEIYRTANVSVKMSMTIRGDKVIEKALYISEDKLNYTKLCDMEGPIMPTQIAAANTQKWVEDHSEQHPNRTLSQSEKIDQFIRYLISGQRNHTKSYLVPDGYKSETAISKDPNCLGSIDFSNPYKYRVNGNQTYIGCITDSDSKSYTVVVRDNDTGKIILDCV